MISIRKINKQGLFYLIIGLFAFLYILIRAYTVSITYDEAWTLIHFVPLSVKNILLFDPCNANNHIANTLLIKLFYLLGVKNVFVARLPNVLASLLYIFFAYKICRTFLNKFSGISLFILLLANPFLLDFFSLARGYGLSLGFQLASLYYFIRFIKRYETSTAIYGLIFGSLAVLSNFSLLNYWLPLIFLINMFSFLHEDRRRKIKLLIGSMIITAILLSLIYEPIVKLEKNGSLYYGGDHDFYTDTLVSLTKYIQYSQAVKTATYWVLNLFLLALLVGILVAVCLKGFSKKNFFSPFSALLLLTSLSVLSTIVQHYFLGTLYLIDRTALFYYPLFILVLCYAYEHIPYIISDITLSLLILLFGVNFIKNANFYKTVTWYFNADIPRLLSYLNKQGKSSNKMIPIDFSWPFQSAISYYCGENLYPFVQVVKNPNDWDDLNRAAEYYIYLGDSVEKAPYHFNDQKILKMNKDTVMKLREKVFLFKLLPGSK